MVKIRSWERFYYQISYEQDQVVFASPNDRACYGGRSMLSASKVFNFTFE